jgi:DNA-binding CsgD family transcriptional regulator
LLQLITQGHTSVEIAEKMFLGYETIRSYRKNLHIKLGAHNTAELTRIALAMKLV